MNGSASAVESLLNLAKSAAPAETREAARQAIVAIQARLGDVGAGRLSVTAATEQGGGLSVATEGGGLSVVTGKS